MYSLKIKDLIRDSFKGITPNYVDHSNVIVLNQKCIRNNQIDFSLARFHDSKKMYPSKKELQIGDILINSTGAGTAGRCAFIRELPKNYSVVADSHILVVRISDFFIAGCVQYSLFNIENLLQTFLDGSTGQGEFDKQRLFNVIIPIPNNPKYIYQFLSNLDKKIALNNQINARLEEMAKTLYDYWFVQFDFPDANGKPYKSSGGEMVFDETLKREIPKGWEVKSLGDWAEIRKGTLITEKTANTNGDIKVISAGVDFSYYHDVANRPKNTITISASGANAGFVNFWREPIFACDCTTITNSVIGRTLYILNFLKIVQDFIYQQARGSAQPHVYPKDIEGLKIIVPPDLLLKRFGEFVENWNLKMANNEKQNHHLTQLRDFLLPMLMNGQVSVAE